MLYVGETVKSSNWPEIVVSIVEYVDLYELHIVDDAWPNLPVSVKCVYESIGVIAPPKGVAITAADEDYAHVLGSVLVRSGIVGVGDASVGSIGVSSV